MYIIGRGGASPPSRLAGADFYIYTYIYIFIGNTAFWSLWAPVLHAIVKPAQSHPVTW